MESETLLASRSGESRGSVLSGILLVSGTSIGAGMLALPAVTGIAGFLPGMAVNAFCWLFMLATGLLFLEATLWMKEKANLLTIAEKLLGPAGKIIGGFSFVFLYYCLLVSYISGGTPILAEKINAVLPYSLSGIEGCLIFSCLFGVIVYLGHQVVDRINWLLMVSLILSYILLISLGSSKVVAGNLLRKEWGFALGAAPVLFSAYGYHNIIPSLTTYLNKNINALRLSIIFGTAIPFLAYSFWQWLIIGTIPIEKIDASSASGIPITHTLQQITGHSFLSSLGGFFGFFALVTSFLGVSLSMVDFFADGLKEYRVPCKNFLLCFLVFLPPSIFAAYNPGIFIEALGVAGGFGEAVLNGLFPVLMVWSGRYYLGYKGPVMLSGGRKMLGVLAVVALVIAGIELKHLFYQA